MTPRRFRVIRFSALFVAISLVSSSAGAQVPALTAHEVMDIADKAMIAVLPPTRIASGVPVAKRGIRFDLARTLEAFGLPRSDSTRARAVSLRSGAGPGSHRMVETCNQVERLPCNEIADAVYASVAPISQSASELRVWLFVSWASRGVLLKSEALGASRLGRLSSIATIVVFSKGSDGRWVFVRTAGAAIA